MVLRIKDRDLASHVAIGGDSGVGKSSLLARAMMQVDARGEMAVIYDPDREYRRKFFDASRGDWVLDPHDAECPWWDIAGEVRTESDAIALATCLFPDQPGSKDPYWQKVAQRFIAWLLARYGPSTAELGYLIANDYLFNEMVDGTEFKSMLSEKSFALRNSVISHLALAAQPMRMMPADQSIRDERGEVIGQRRRFTIREYCDTRQGWVFITSKPKQKAAMTPLHTMWLAGIILGLMSMGRRDDLPRTHIFFEEASDFVVQEFLTALKRLRKCNVPVWYAIQNFIEFKNGYGDSYRTIFAQAKTKVLMRTSEGFSAGELESATGQAQYWRLDESENTRRGFRIFQGGRTWRPRKVREPLIGAEEFLNWDDRKCVVLQPGVAVPCEIPYVVLPDRGVIREVEPQTIERRSLNLTCSGDQDDEDNGKEGFEVVA